MRLLGNWPRAVWSWWYQFCCHRGILLGLATLGLIPFLWRRLRLKAPREDAGRNEEADLGAKEPREISEEQEEEKEKEQEEEEEEFNGADDAVEPTDPFYSAYDSTWEDEPSRGSDRRVQRTMQSSDYKFNRFQSAGSDMQNYRHDYPSSTGSRFQKNQQGDDMPNLKFYQGKIPSVPDGFDIGEFHQKWWGDYSKLERVHTFIQWLFPLQEAGMNYEAYPLTKPEIEAFCKDDKAHLNLRTSYELMLDFYGMKLYNPDTGEVRRADNWENRFKNLNRNTHNNLRLTRILKCLGTLGFEHYQAPLVRFFLEETLVYGNLDKVKESALNYFLFTVRDKVERRELVRFAYLNYEPKSEFIWCPKKIQRRFASQKTAMSGPHSLPADELL